MRERKKERRRKRERERERERIYTYTYSSVRIGESASAYGPNIVSCKSEHCTFLPGLRIAILAPSLHQPPIVLTEKLIEL